MRFFAACCAVFAAAGCATVAPAVDPLVVPTSEAWRAAAPTPGPAPDVEAPRFEKFRLRNGLLVIVSERRDLPMLSMRVAVRGGSAEDAQDKSGLASLTYELLLEGAGGLDAVALAEAFAEVGASPTSGAGESGGSVGATALVRNADAVMGLLAKVIRQPTLDGAAFERIKARQLAQLQRMAGEPNYLASRALSRAVFGPDHPYGRPASGTAHTVSSLTVDDASAFWSAHAAPGNAAVILVGDINPTEARELVGKHFHDWSGEAAARPTPTKVEASNRREVLMVRKPGLEQTVIALGRPAIAHGDEREWALRTAVAAWGGTFGSRLNMNLREDKGYTYGARAAVRPSIGAGSLIAFTSVRRDVTGPALAEVMNEMSGLDTRPLTDAELSAARDALLLSIPGSFETAQDIGTSAAGLFLDELPLDRYRTMIEAYRSIGRDACRAAAEAFLAVEPFHIVLVGDPDVIGEAVETLGLGPLREVEPLAE